MTEAEWRRVLGRRRRSPWQRHLRGMMPGLFLAIAVVVLLGAVNSRGFDWPGARVDRPVTLRGGNAWGGVNVPENGSATAGRVSHVRDGDTIEIGGRAIRIAALDCAERGQPGVAAATARMRVLAGSGHLRCSLTGQRSYDRWIGSCSLPDGRDLAGVMIGEGLCRRFR